MPAPRVTSCAYPAAAPTAAGGRSGLPAASTRPTWRAIRTWSPCSNRSAMLRARSEEAEVAALEAFAQAAKAIENARTSALAGDLRRAEDQARVARSWLIVAGQDLRYARR